MSHGLLTVGGIISFFFGGLMLVDTVDPELRVSLSVLITMVVMVTVLAVVVGWLVIRAQRNRPFVGKEGLVGKTAEVRHPDLVYIDGALWKARSHTGEALDIGGNVEVVSVDKLTLVVKKANA